MWEGAFPQVSMSSSCNLFLYSNGSLNSKSGKLTLAYDSDT